MHRLVLFWQRENNDNARRAAKPGLVNAANESNATFDVDAVVEQRSKSIRHAGDATCDPTCLGDGNQFNGASRQLPG
jgi:hypothetical protein